MVLEANPNILSIILSFFYILSFLFAFFFLAV